MSDALPTEPELPTAPVISYFTSVSSPTRVRLIARTGLKITAFTNGMILLAALAALAGFLMLSKRHAQDGWVHFLVLMSAVALGCGLGQWLCDNAVGLGNALACRFAFVSLYPLIVTFWLLCVLPAAVAVAVTESGRFPNWALGLTFTLCAVWFLSQIIISLLIYDLVRFLQWIAEHPTIEKPTLPFLSVRQPEFPELIR